MKIIIGELSLKLQRVTDEFCPQEPHLQPLRNWADFKAVSGSEELQYPFLVFPKGGNVKSHIWESMIVCSMFNPALLVDWTEVSDPKIEIVEYDPKFLKKFLIRTILDSKKTYEVEQALKHIELKENELALSEHEKALVYGSPQQRRDASYALERDGYYKYD